MSLEENKELVRRYIEAIDENATSDWSILDDCACCSRSACCPAARKTFYVVATAMP